MKLKIISIGPGDPSLINEVTIQAIRTADPLVLRTGHHSLSHWLKTMKLRLISIFSRKLPRKGFGHLLLTILKLFLQFPIP